MSILIITDNPRSNGVWPAWFRSEGYEVDSQDIHNSGIVMYPFARPSVILMHVTELPLEQALAAVRMFRKCHPSSHVIAVTPEFGVNGAFREAGATVHLSEPVDHALVFRMVEMLSRRKGTRHAKRPAVPRIRHATPHTWENKPLAQPAE